MTLDKEKSSEFYLKQIDKNIDEKISYLIDLLSENKIPRNKNGDMKIIEFGVGGGSQFDIISRYAPCNSTIIGADIVKDILNNVDTNNVQKNLMDITNITEPNESVSVINASAILHEVSSYGDFKNNFGLDALKTTFQSVNRSLVPNGYFIYRDLLYPIRNFKNKKVYYRNIVWKYFYNYFLRDFIKNDRTSLYAKEVLICDNNNEGFFLETSSVVHREFQRHYITFRDFVRNKLSKITNVNILDHFWEDKSVGKKVFIVEISNNNDLINKFSLKKCDRLSTGKRKIYRIDSDIFDIFYDDVILELFIKKDEKFILSINEWKKREGMEMYLYAGFIKLLKISIESLDPNPGYVLFPESLHDIVTVERVYYNRYLEKNISNPEIDGKQIIIFKKMKIETALIVAKELLDSKHVKDEVLDLIKIIKSKIIL